MMNVDRGESHLGANNDPEHQSSGGHSRHRQMMIVCCIPILVVAVALIISATVGIGSLVLALGCMGMLAAMMFPMRKI
ncbi:hypothetical protein [Nocardia sp. 348MFTsu5.1]|uniref:hypothetical protein n=1 Tax=Nocardia sp. 348MFTsu5.1 TaxID=1172185 RepID=UPI00037CD31D|nr:hypothetical protein [Nocardia sp. 348MFTsu5.1]